APAPAGRDGARVADRGGGARADRLPLGQLCRERGDSGGASLVRHPLRQQPQWQPPSRPERPAAAARGGGSGGAGRGDRAPGRADRGCAGAAPAPPALRGLVGGAGGGVRACGGRGSSADHAGQPQLRARQPRWAAAQSHPLPPFRAALRLSRRTRARPADGPHRRPSRHPARPPRQTAAAPLAPHRQEDGGAALVQPRLRARPVTAAVALPFRVGARTLWRVRLRLARVAVSLEQAQAGTVPRLPALGSESDGYLITSLPEERLPDVRAAHPELRPFVRQLYRRNFASLEGSFDDYLAGFSAKSRSTLKR